MKRRYAAFVWNVDGDMGEAQVIGPFRTVDEAERKAATIRKRAERMYDPENYVNVHAMVIDVLPGSTSARDAVGRSVR